MKIQTTVKSQLPIPKVSACSRQSGVADCRLLIGSGSGNTRRNSSIENGFTLVELLLVLVILATLAAIVLPKFTGTSQRARITAAVTQISTFKTALNAYEVDMGSYPKSLQDLLVRPQNAGQDWHGPYLDHDTIPQDPWHNNYIYTFPGKHNPSSFDIMSPGPDGQVGTADDICNWTTGNNAN